MSEPTPEEIEQIRRLMAEAFARDPSRLAVHEAGHAVAALHLGMDLESSNLETAETSDGPKLGGTKVRGIGESFSEADIQKPTAAVIEHARREVIMLFAATAAEVQILGKSSDFNQRDLSRIRCLVRFFPELQGSLQELETIAHDVVAKFRDAIERVARALDERKSIDGDQVTRLVEHSDA